MPNNNDRKIIERLTDDPALEMKSHELEKILESELNKPAEEIDAQLVGELLDVLQPDEVCADLRQKTWKEITARSFSKPRRSNRVLCRLAAVAAIMILIFGMTIGAAHAFRWTFLLKLLQPVAETFGIYMNYSDEQLSETAPENKYSMSEDENTTVLFTDLNEIPNTYQGYAIKPGWIPEGYTFVQASSFSDVNLLKYSLVYQRGTDELCMFITAYPDSDTMSSHFYERVEKKVGETILSSKLVTFYRNAKDKIQSVSWVDGNIHYSVNGSLTIDEIERIIGSFLIEQPE